MQPLDQDIQLKKTNLLEFKETTLKILGYLPNVLTDFKEKGGYRIYSSNIAGTTKYVRPINSALFIYKPDEFEVQFEFMVNTLQRLKRKESVFSIEQNKNIDTTLYTIQQSIGAGFDLLVESNSARKHVGNRFEELIRSVFNEIGIANKKTVLKIPYETPDGTKTYSCENDLILSPYSRSKSDNKTLDVNEIVVSVKTTSKDRMGKMFIDKMLLERFVEHKQKVIGIFLNDVQRKKNNNISYTLVSNLFMVYSKFLVQLDGIYYLDPPPNSQKLPISRHMKPLSKLLTEDIWTLLAP